MEFEYENPPEMTTLSVPQKFRKFLAENYEGRNDLERLRNWASDFSEDQAEQAAYDYIAGDVFKEEVEAHVRDIIRDLYFSYNADNREDLEEIIKETVRDMQGGRY